MNAENTLSLIADVNALNLRAPVTTIAERTGETKADVSACLRGKKTAGFVFLVKFYEAFAADLEKIGRKKIVTVIISQRNILDELVALNERAQKTLQLTAKTHELTINMSNQINRVFRYDKAMGDQQPSKN